MAAEPPVTPPVLQGPTAKEKKYDRQLRLWAAAGQQALEDAHILLLNNGSGVVGVETLKNLVLPGVGHVHLVDEAVVGQEDLGVNFFLEESSLGKSRAEECCRFLQELNPDVTAIWDQKSIADFVKKADLSQYNLILLIAPTGSLELASQVSDIAWDLRLPLIYVHSVGFYSYFSLQLPPSFPIVETHPDATSTQDLRLLQPWPELSEYTTAQTSDLENFSDHDHGHVPYIILLLHYLEKWKESHGGVGLNHANHKEKQAFKDFVRSHARISNSDGGEENFDEALAAANFALRPPEVPSALKAVLAEEEAQNPRNSSPNFWIIANAIASFVSTHKVLPLPGTLPDMKAQSRDYIALQNLYRQKSQQDIAEITNSVRTLEQRLNRHVPIESREIESFSKGAGFVKLIRGRKLVVDPAGSHGWGEDSKPTTIAEYATAMNYVTMKPSLFPIVIALHAFDAAVAGFYSNHHSSASGSTSATADLLAYTSTSTFAAAMQTYVESVFAALGQSEDLDTALQTTLSIAKEIQRSGPGELHNIASLTGGMVAQEVIKVITKQYVPVDNVCVFDGIVSATACWRL